MKVFDWSIQKEPLSFYTPEILQGDEFKALQYILQTEPLNPKNFEQDATSMHKWSIPASENVLSLFPQRTEKVQLLEVFDCLIPKKNGEGDLQFWPDILIVSVLRNLIRDKVETLDLRGHAYIIGESAWVRVLAMVAVRLGYAHITLVTPNEESVKKHLQILRRKLMGIDFEMVLTQELTLQPQQAGLVFNCLDLSQKKESLQDIAYFNFMLSDGIFINLMDGTSQKLLHDEAERAHLKTIPAREVELAWWREVCRTLKSQN